MCSCNSCIRGALIDCSFEPGVQVNSREINSSDDESDEGDYDYDDENISEVELEEQRLRRNCVLEMLQPDNILQSFCPLLHQNYFTCVKFLSLWFLQQYKMINITILCQVEQVL